MLQVDLLIVLQWRVGGEKNGARDGDDDDDDGRSWQTAGRRDRIRGVGEKWEREGEGNEV